MPDNNTITLSKVARAALAYAAAGWHVFPLRPGGKLPLHEGGVNAATCDAATIRKWWGAAPTANVGVALAASGLGVVDVDVKPDKGVDGRALMDELALLYGLPSTLVQVTASGGLHHVFKQEAGTLLDATHWPAERRDKAKHTGVDILTAGHRYIVVAPSVVTGGGVYRWQGAITREVLCGVGTLPQPWCQLLRAQQVRRAQEPTTEGADLLDIVALRVPGVTIDELKSVLEVLPPEAPRDEWLRVLWGAAAQWSGTKDEQAALDALDAWSALTTVPGQYKAGEVAKRWAEHTADGGGTSGAGHVTWRSVRATARDAGWTPFSMGGVDPKTWKAALITKRKSEEEGGGIMVRNVPWNCALFMAYDPTLAGCVRRNVLTNAVEMHSASVCPLRDPSRLPVEFKKESDWVGAAQALNGRVHGDVSRECIVSAVVAAADVHAYDPIKQWVDSLAWDGVPRIDTWLPYVTGCEDSPLNRQIGRKWVIGMAGRATTEYDGRGVKMDSVLVLQGKEGIGKSTVGSIMGGEWYASFSNSLDNENVYYVIERCMVLEFDELDAMSRSEATRVKSMVTTQADTFRRKYDPNASIKPRRCVFIGTTNDSSFLTKDMTVRRWWVVPCGSKKFDLRWLAHNREQLIAEAVVAMRRGELPMLDEGLREAQGEAVSGVLMAHPYEDAIEEWTRAQPDLAAVSLAAAVEQAIGRAMVSLTMGELRKFGECMRGAGWSKEARKEGKRWVLYRD